MYFGVARCRLIPNKNNNNRLESFMALDDYDFNLAAYLHVRKRFRYRYICIYVCVRLHNLFINCIIVISIASAFNAKKKKWPPTERCWSSWRFSFFLFIFPSFLLCVSLCSLYFFFAYTIKKHYINLNMKCGVTHSGAMPNAGGDSVALRQTNCSDCRTTLEPATDVVFFFS